MSDPRDLLRGVNRFYDSLNEVVAGQVLRCEACGLERPAEGRFFREGWPMCHGVTMPLVSAKEDER